MSDSSIGYTAQLDAMAKIMEALEPLEADAKKSVLDWVDSQIGRAREPAASADVQERLKGKQQARDAEGTRRQGTVSTVAQKLGANSCRTLLLSGAVHLTLYQGKDSFTRDELIATAKDARGWKSDYSNQMATAINRMLDAGELFEKSKDVFSLSDEKLAEVESKLVVG